MNDNKYEFIPLSPDFGFIIYVESVKQTISYETNYNTLLMCTMVSNSTSMNELTRIRFYSSSKPHIKGKLNQEAMSEQ